MTRQRIPHESQSNFMYKRQLSPTILAVFLSYLIVLMSEELIMRITSSEINLIQ